VAGAKTKGGYQFPFVDEPELDIASTIAAGQTTVSEYCKGRDVTL